MRELEESNCEVQETINYNFRLSFINNKSLHDDEPISFGQKETLGGFLDNTCNYAWLAHNTHLTVINAKTGDCISTWDFPQRISCVSPFPTKEGDVPLILIGFDNDAIKIKDSVGQLCIYDSTISCVLKTIQVPAGVEKACVIHGGSETEEFNEKRPNTILANNCGLIFVALRNLQHLVIDLARDTWGKNCDNHSVISEIELTTTEHSKLLLNNQNDRVVHSAYSLVNKEIENYIGFNREDFEALPLYDENLTSVILSSEKVGCLITGCLGRVIIWQINGSVSWISPLFDENMFITHLALVEPTDDPRPFYYLWIASQNDTPDSSPVLRMYALLFEKKYPVNGSNLYYDLSCEPSLKFELELEEGEKIHSLFSIERESYQDNAFSGIKRGEDSLLLIGTNERLLLFDLNRWYKEQMPRTMAECRNPNSVMSSYRRNNDNDCAEKNVLACLYQPLSLKDFPIKGPNSPEELYYPNSLALEWTEICTDSIIFWMTRGVQAEIIREMLLAGPMILIKPTEIYHRCMEAGLIPFDASMDYSYSSDKVIQREMLLSLCLEQKWTNFLTHCAQEWSDGSAAYLYPGFLKWTVQRAMEIKAMTDRLCVPLFDQSGTNIGESELKTLRFCALQLECLSDIISRLPNFETDLQNQQRALKRVATYLQVVLWFYDVGLLPETQKLEESPKQKTHCLQIPYPRDKMCSLYETKRGNLKDKESLFIDKLINIECSGVKRQWEKEGINSPKRAGFYPPPSLQSVLRSFLVDCYQKGQSDIEEIESKHKIIIYFLMDVAMILENSYNGVDQLMKYPSAFKLNPSLIKLTQAFWLLDHEDYEGFFDSITGQLVCKNDIKDWHHKLIMDTLLNKNQHKHAFMYLRVHKPPQSSLEDQSIVIGLSVEHGLIQSAFHNRPHSHYKQLLMRFFQACKVNGRIKDILHLALDNEEEETFLQFLKEDGCEETRLLYYLQRYRHVEANDVFSINNKFINSKTSNKMHMLPLKMLEAYNATLPEITKCFARSLTKNAVTFNNEEDSRYFKPMSHCKSKFNEIYDLAIKKTKETYSKSSKCYIPFLGAPCSTIFATRTSQQNELDSQCIYFPKRKNNKKRNLDQMQEIDNCKKSNKKRKLTDSSNQYVNFNLTETPLVMRKIDPSNKNENITLETPHSILKIRQMIRRNSSTSPAYKFSSESEAALRSSATFKKPIRQIRFSMDRFSGNDSTSSANEEILENCDIPDDSNINYNHSAEDNDKYYSPNISSKSIREASILNETTFDSMESRAKGPRPRRSIRRSCVSSHASSQSEDSSFYGNSSIEASNIFTPMKKQKSDLNTSPKSLFCETMYASTILSSNTSLESSFIEKKCSQAEIIEADFTETSISDTEDECTQEDEQKNEIKNFDSGLAKDSLTGSISSNLNTFQCSQTNERFKHHESASDEIETDLGSQKTVDTENTSININHNTIELNASEISEDEDKNDDFHSFSNSLDIGSTPSENKNSFEKNSFSDILENKVKILSAEVDITDDETSQDAKCFLNSNNINAENEEDGSMVLKLSDDEIPVNDDPNEISDNQKLEDDKNLQSHLINKSNVNCRSRSNSKESSSSCLSSSSSTRNVETVDQNELTLRRSSRKAVLETKKIQNQPKPKLKKRQSVSPVPKILESYLKEKKKNHKNKNFR